MTMYISYLQDILRSAELQFESKEQFQKGYEYGGDEMKQRGKKGKKGMKIIKPFELNIESPLVGEVLQRYSRQMLMKEVGYAGQKALLSAQVGVVGAGGIGCPLALYLAAAGVGTLHLFDSDRVELSNLHRQIGHSTSSLGTAKTESLRRRLLQINPLIRVIEHEKVSSENVEALSECTVVVDGSDNPLCRYLVNDVCMRRGKVLLSGACVGWEAQITCYGGTNACYRCVWGDEQVSMGGCSELGVLGPVPGLVGVVLATECIKLITHNHSSLQGHMLLYNAKNATFKTIRLRNKNNNCLCSQQHHSLPNYVQHPKCGLQNIDLDKVLCIDWEQAISIQHQKIHIDCRPSHVYNIVHFKQSINIPLEELRQMDRKSIQQKCGGPLQNKVVIISCAKGNASKKAVQHLNAFNVKCFSVNGGIAEYGLRYDSDIPKL